MPRDILIMTSDVDGIRQLKVDANACELRLPGLPGLRLGLADLEFLASYLPMIAEAAFARASVPPLFPEEDTVGAVRQDAAKGAVPRAQDRRCTPSEDQDCEVIENESPAPDRAAGMARPGTARPGTAKRASAGRTKKRPACDSVSSMACPSPKLRPSSSAAPAASSRVRSCAA